MSKQASSQTNEIKNTAQFFLRAKRALIGLANRPSWELFFLWEKEKVKFYPTYEILKGNIYLNKQICFIPLIAQIYPYYNT